LLLRVVYGTRDGDVILFIVHGSLRRKERRVCGVLRNTTLPSKHDPQYHL